ncbi:hypothetical protein CBS115989_7512 [Aspergillus niger]|nr:hypothetical protein CBS115989_7512 [Aspergillus niger]KAI2833936.1 hypothetical protein CBS11232_10941 [Aspergillus niger]KAI2867957.1 hypothetical protein CBS115988_10982 [Aspergillus niger]
MPTAVPPVGATGEASDGPGQTSAAHHQPAAPATPYHRRSAGPAGPAVPAVPASPAEARGPTRVQLERSRIADALEDAGVSVPEGVLPPSRDLTPAQRLRKKELREELANLKSLERQHKQLLQEKEEKWAMQRKVLVDMIKIHDEKMAVDVAPVKKLVTDVDISIKKAVEELEGLV